jgi:hypothetical protein
MNSYTPFGAAGLARNEVFPNQLVLQYVELTLQGCGAGL